MNIDMYMSELASRAGIKKLFLILLSASIITNFLLGAVILAKKDKIQTILVPPEIQRTVTVSNMSISREYLEEMGLFMTQQLLNTSPSSVDGQYRVLLKYVDPRYFQALERELTITKKWIRRNNVSTWFTPRRITGFPNNNTVVIEGQFMVSQGDTISQKSTRKLIITFKNVDGKIALVSIKEEVRKKSGKVKSQKAGASEPVSQVVQDQNDALDEDGTEVVDYVGE